MIVGLSVEAVNLLELFKVETGVCIKLYNRNVCMHRIFLFAINVCLISAKCGETSVYVDCDVTNMLHT